MGRTIVPFNQLVQGIKQEDWGKFRRALRREDQERLDALFEMARHHAGPAAYASRPNPMEPILIGMLIELLRRIETLEEHMHRPEKSNDHAQQELDL
jgi:hypothetical protein